MKSSFVKFSISNVCAPFIRQKNISSSVVNYERSVRNIVFRIFIFVMMMTANFPAIKTKMLYPFFYIFLNFLKCASVVSFISPPFFLQFLLSFFHQPQILFLTYQTFSHQEICDILKDSA